MTRPADGLGVDIAHRRAGAVAPWFEQRDGPEWRCRRLDQPIEPAPASAGDA